MRFHQSVHGRSDTARLHTRRSHACRPWPAWTIATIHHRARMVWERYGILRPGDVVAPYHLRLLISTIRDGVPVLEAWLEFVKMSSNEDEGYVLSGDWNRIDGYGLLLGWGYLYTANLSAFALLWSQILWDISVSLFSLIYSTLYCIRRHWEKRIF